jgi:hypothetical protein
MSPWRPAILLRGPTKLDGGLVAVTGEARQPYPTGGPREHLDLRMAYGAVPLVSFMVVCLTFSSGLRPSIKPAGPLRTAWPSTRWPALSPRCMTCTRSSPRRTWLASSRDSSQTPSEDGKKRRPQLLNRARAVFTRLRAFIR